MSRGKKRFWSDEEKREICAQATKRGMSVAQVARRYAVNATLIFKWLKDPRFAPEADAADQGATFLPVEIEADIVRETSAVDLSPVPPPSSPLSASRVDITLSDGRRILIEGPTVLAAVVSLVQGLAI
ncbi:MAG: transposase [Roseobacter sp.]|jgi:transposase